MKAIQDAVTAYLQEQTGVRTVADRTRVQGEYPMLAVAVRENGTVLVSGGTQAEHTYRVTVTAASDRNRDGNTALLASLVPLLLRGVPMEANMGGSDGSEGYASCGKRVLHPLDIRTEGEELTFSLELCVALPQPEKPGMEPPGIMTTLNLGV